MMLLLLVGCSGETNLERVFDGSLTHLSLKLERSSIRAHTQGQNLVTEEMEVAHVRVTRPDEGEVVLATRKIELEPNTGSFVVDIELPAKKGYSINAIVLQGDRFLEIGVHENVDAPARTITSYSIKMEEPSYTLDLSEQIHGGDKVNITIPDHQRPFIHADVLLGVNPWQTNGIAGLWAANSGGINPTGWLVGEIGFFPEVSEATQLYYQIRISLNKYWVPDLESWPSYYAPDIDIGEKLPSIWLNP